MSCRNKLSLVGLLTLMLCACLALAQSSQTTLNGTYRLGALSLKYPESWQVQAHNTTSVTIAPASARTTTKTGKSWLTEGLVAGVGQQRSGGLESAVDALFQNFKKSNPYALR